MNNLIHILKKETKSLKKQYIELTKKWSINHYNNIIIKKTWTELDWCKFLNLTPELHNPTSPSISFLGFPKGFYNTKKSKNFFKLKNEISILSRITIEQYTENQVKLALLHYENSIFKLCERIKKKDLDITKLKTKTSHIGLNINTVLTDGNKVVKAFTIIAEGHIQRPHYRYLVK